MEKKVTQEVKLTVLYPKEAIFVAYMFLRFLVLC